MDLHDRRFDRNAGGPRRTLRAARSTRVALLIRASLISTAVASVLLPGPRAEGPALPGPATTSVESSLSSSAEGAGIHPTAGEGAGTHPTAAEAPGPGNRGAPPPVQGPPDRMPAPTFRLLDPRGNPVDSAYDSRPVTVVHFWASWCIPCMREIPEMNRMAAAYEPRGAALFAVALYSGKAGDLRQLEKAYDIRHRVLLGEERLATNFGGIPSFPTTYVVDGSGRIVDRYVGATPEVRERIEASIRALLAAAKVPPSRP